MKSRHRQKSSSKTYRELTHLISQINDYADRVLGPESFDAQGGLPCRNKIGIAEAHQPWIPRTRQNSEL